LIIKTPKTLEEMAETTFESEDRNTLIADIESFHKHSLAILKEKSTNITHLDEKCN